jgi:transcriptional regulator of acetoin/glycerol metabolism
MTTLLATTRKPLGILPLVEVKRRAVVDALEQYHGDHLLAARLLGIGRTTVYRMDRAYRSQSTPGARGRVGGSTFSFVCR